MYKLTVIIYIKSNDSQPVYTPGVSDIINSLFQITIYFIKAMTESISTLRHFIESIHQVSLMKIDVH